MQVIATAGHVDHGKSALVRALTGMEPDRWEAERRRGLTIDLGYAWLTLPSGERIAFVDVPGHERFVPNMLAGVGPVPAVMFVVAADGGWMPQSAEHLAAIDALGISHGLLVATRSDLADPEPALRQAAERIAASSLGEVESCAVSAVTGEGLPGLLAALGRLADRLPRPDPAAPVRLWVDRAFSIKGSGTVVTGTLPAGTVSARDELAVAPSGRVVRVRGLQSLKQAQERVSGVARVALNLRGTDAGSLGRGMALVTPGAWTVTSLIDVRIGPAEPDGPAELAGPGAAGASREPPRELTLHIGSARTTARVRPLGGRIARLALHDPLPLHVGDRLLLRSPGAAAARTSAPAAFAAAAAGRPDGAAAGPRPPLTGATVLDVAPPSFAGRGAAAAAARVLAAWPAPPRAADLLRRHGLLRERALRAMGVMGVSGHPAPVAGDWLVDPDHWQALGRRLPEVVAAHAARDPLAAGMPAEAARAALGVPDRRLVEALARSPVRLADGLLTLASPAAPPAGPSAPAASAGAAPPQPGLAPGAEAALGAGLEPESAHGAGPARGSAPGAAAASAGGSAQSPAGAPRPARAGAARAGPALAQPAGHGLPERVAAAVAEVRRGLDTAPFAAPEADRLRDLGLDGKALAAAARAGLLLRISDQIVLAPGADAAAAAVLARLPQPFTTAEARKALGTTRRVAIPLLEHLDRAGATRRLPDDRRQMAR